MCAYNNLPTFISSDVEFSIDSIQLEAYPQVYFAQKYFKS